MIQIQQIKLKIPHKETDVKKKFCKILHIPEKRVRAFRILKRSLDARGAFLCLHRRGRGGGGESP